MPNIADARRTYATTLAFVTDRGEIPAVLNERRLFGCGVEVGVKEGDYSWHLLRYWAGRHLISVDPWSHDASGEYVDIANVAQQQHEAFYQKTCSRLAEFGPRSTIWRMTSLEAAERIPDASLDFVYIDARHDFKAVMEDLEAWYPKVRPGGLIMGHDYIDGDFDAGRFDVKTAVDGFFASLGLVAYPTMMDEPCLSWMVEMPTPDVSYPALDGAATEAGSEARQAPSAPIAPPAAPTPAAAPDHDLRTVSLTFGSNGTSREVVLKLDPAQMSQKIMLDCFDANQLYEWETSQFLATVLKPGDGFVDVGTHVGYFSMLAASLVGDSGKVISFEPDERNFAQLLDHVETNGFRHVKPVNAAVSDHSGKGEFHVNLDNDGGHALWNVGDHPFNEQSRNAPTTREVELVALDEVLAEFENGPPRVIKIDAEGAEHSVLKGARHYLSTTPVPFIIAEINHFGLEKMGTTEDALRGYMTDLGYETFAFDNENNRLVKLGEGDRVVSDYVFNLVFRHPAALAA